MLTQALVKAAGIERPDLVQKTALALAELELINPAFAAETSDEFSSILSRTEELLQTREKTADAKPFTDAARNFGLGLAGTLVAGLGAAVATDLYDASKRGLTKGHNFRRIMEANPQLKEEFDKKEIQTAFNTLHRYGPEFTADPMVGGALVGHLARVPEVSHKQVMELLAARKNLAESKGKYFNPHGMSSVGQHLIPDEKEAKPPPPDLEASDKRRHEYQKELADKRHEQQMSLEDYKANLRKNRP